MTVSTSPPETANEPDRQLSSAQRNHAQRNVLLSSLFGPITFNILAGQYMMLFASDVLKFDPLSIATIFALVPLVSILRIAAVRHVRRFGRIRTFISGRIIQVVVVVILLTLPYAHLSLTLLTVLLMIFLAARELGINLVWPSLIRDITMTRNRGRYLGRLQFSFSITTLLISGAIIVVVGATITQEQYRILLGIALIGLVNSCFWIRQIPDRAEADTASLNEETVRRRSFFYILRHSSLLRLPLLVSLLSIAASLPLAIVYFRQVLEVPANLVTIYIFTITLGQVLFFYIWGQMADTIGFRPMLIGLLSLTAVTTPIIFFVPPFPGVGFSWSTLSPETLMGTGALLLLGLSNGILTSGILTVATSIQHYHVRPEESLEAMNIFSVVQVTFQALVFFLAGIFLTHIVMPGGIHPLWNGLIHLDWYKVYAAVVAPLLLLVSIPIAKRLPNLRPWFRVSDFFSALFHSPARTVYASRRVYDEAKERRAELAHWFGANPNPMVIEPLLELLRDPSFDVKVEAIRSLAHTGSALAGQELSIILADEEHRSLWDHTAWALGELRHIPASELLVVRLSQEMPPRVRAMSARALGKIGDESAIGPLVKILEEENRNLSVVSAACLSLLQLNAREHAVLALDALLRLRSREDRYELMSAFCEWLEIRVHWLLNSTSDQSSWASLNTHLDFRSDSWRKDHQSTINAFREKNHDQIVRFLIEQLEAAENDRYPAARALAQVAKETDQWSPLSVLATAWLLYKGSS